MYNEPLTFDVVPGSTADTRIFRLHGPITLSNLFDFQKVLTGGTEKVTILDFTESEYIDSAGLGVILNYYVSGKRHGRTIRLVAVNYRVAELLKLTSANTLIKSLRQHRSRGSRHLVVLRSTQVPTSHEDGEPPPRHARGRRPPAR